MTSNTPDEKLDDLGGPQGKPVFKHDCLSCQYLGTYDGRDLYYCSGLSDTYPTVVARWGNLDGNYASGIGLAERMRLEPIPGQTHNRLPPDARALRVAYLIAKDLNLNL